MTIANLFFFFKNDQCVEVESFNLVEGDLQIALDSGET